MTDRVPKIQPLSPELIVQIQDVYDRGLALQAYKLGIVHGPLASWQPAEAQVLAGRIAVQLGAPRLSKWLHRCAYRAVPDLPEAQYFFALCLAQYRGSYAAWRWISRRDPPQGASADLLSSWFALIGNTASAFRDFETANLWMAKAHAADPGNAWVHVCEAAQREAEDRYDEALALARQALSLRPWYRPAVQSAAHLLTLQGRDSEALDLLREGNERVENSYLAAQQYALEVELHDHAAAARSLDRYEATSPILEKPGREWLSSQRAEVCYRMGDFAAAIRHGRESNQDYWKTIADRLEDPQRATAKATLLPVGFVRQHHMTCGPATLTALSKYWSLPADHLQVAEQICYNGTTHYNERKWAHDNGWIAREFSVTEESAAALLDRGIPFTFTTIDPGNAHLQAIIGHDGRRGTLSVRDPYFRNSGEPLADKLLDRYRAYGPRGMLLAPQSASDRLAEVNLPDAELWDALHALDHALNSHRRDDTSALLEQMRTAAPTHRLTYEAQRRLAIYDGNAPEQLAAVEALLGQFPDNQSLQLERLALLRDHSQRQERLETYERLLAKKETHPIFWQQYAQELRCDARRHGDAVWRLRRAIRRWPTEASSYYILANVYWDQRRFDEALELYRIAACLGDKNEHFVGSYYRAAAWFKATERVLEFLRDRFTRFGKQSYLPAASLVSAYQDLERTPEAIAVVNQAIELRPNDGDLLLYAADMLAHATPENLQRCRALLDQAKDKAAQAHWLRTAAKIERLEGDLAGSLTLWQQLLILQPLAIDAHRAIARLLAETKSPAAAIEYLSAAAEQFPHYYPLHQLLVEWVREEPLELREPLLRKVVAAFPHDAWAHRELAFLLAGSQRVKEAWNLAATAEHLEPTNPSLLLLQAALHQQQNQLDQARQALRAAIVLGVDNDYAIRELIELCPNLAERRKELSFVKDELVRQVTFGDGLLSYRQHARDTLDPAELLALLQQALAERPDLWHAWSAVVQQLQSMNRLDEAFSLIQQATERFPHLPRLWLDRAAVCRYRDDLPGELEALQAAYRINPSWNTAVHSLAAALQRRGDYQAARELLERAVAREPLDVALRGLWAEALWRAGERDLALSQVQYLVQLEPGSDRSWDLLQAWSRELGCPERAIVSVRELSQRRAGEARSWLLLARLLNRPEDFDERLQALDKALQLSHRVVDIHDQRAVLLAGAERWDEALAACRPEVFGNYTPPELRWRAAWIESQRSNLPAAVARLRELVADEPRYSAAWSSLADWYSQLGDHEHYLEAARALVAINPQYEVSHGYLGEALLLSGNRPAALEAFERAFALSPQYEYAGNSIFDIQFEDGNLTGAEQTIAVLRAHGDSAFVLAREARLAARQQRIARAGEILKRFAVQEDDSPWPLAVTLDALVEAGAADTAERVLEESLLAPNANPQIGRNWVELQLKRNYWLGERRLQQLVQQNGPVGERAVYAYLDALARTGDADNLYAFIYSASWLKQNDQCWGSVGYALTLLRAYRRTFTWMQDWRSRPSAQPWMLVNAAEGFRGVGQTQEAREISFAALQKQADNGTRLHKLWLACDAAVAGDVPTAVAHLEHIDRNTLDSDYAFLATCVTAVLDLAAAPPDKRPAAFRQAFHNVRTARRQYAAYAQEPARQSVFRGSLWQLARLRGTWFARAQCALEWLLTR